MPEPNPCVSFRGSSHFRSCRQRMLPLLRYFLLAGHHKGHGIHSPSLYHLVSHVLFNKNRYYCFDSIEYLFPAPKLEHTIGQTLFRLAEDIKATTLVACCYSGSIDLAYLMTVRADARILCLSTTEQSLNQAKNSQELMDGCSVNGAIMNDIHHVKQSFNNLSNIDLAVFDACTDTPLLTNLFELCLEHAHTNSLFFVKDIHTRHMEQNWKSMVKHPQVTASLDVFQYGILLFNPDLEKKQYIIRH